MLAPSRWSSHSDVCRLPSAHGTERAWEAGKAGGAGNGNGMRAGSEVKPASRGSAGFRRPRESRDVGFWRAVADAVQAGVFLAAAKSSTSTSYVSNICTARQGRSTSLRSRNSSRLFAGSFAANHDTLSDSAPPPRPPNACAYAPSRRHSPLTSHQPSRPVRGIVPIARDISIAGGGGKGKEIGSGTSEQASKQNPTQVTNKPTTNQPTNRERKRPGRFFFTPHQLFLCVVVRRSSTTQSRSLPLTYSALARTTAVALGYGPTRGCLRVTESHGLFFRSCLTHD